MNTIPSVFTERGFNFTQIARDGMIALYHRGKPGGTGHYELVRLSVAHAAKIYGREYPEREVYPHSEKWGIDGFTILSRETALERFTEMVNARDREPKENAEVVPAMVAQRTAAQKT